MLAKSVPFKPNVSSIARKIGASRDSVYEWLRQLQKARLLNFLIAGGKGISLLQKPDKVYMESTNLSHAQKASPAIGSIRETFFLNQLIKQTTLQGFETLGGLFYDRSAYVSLTVDVSVFTHISFYQASQRRH